MTSTYKMDYEASSMHDVLERMLHDESAKPCVLPLSLLRAITNDFHAQEIGKDAFGVFYKGVLRNGTVAVKKYRLREYDDEERFQNEVRCHIGLKHKNIVRLLGYCAESESEMMDYEGKMVLVEKQQRLLCYEYLRGRSLAEYITDASHGIGWKKRYKVIKGICEGLYYLHQNLTVHLDLSLVNVWLDEKKVPKIHDFSSSKRLEGKQSEVIVEAAPIGTIFSCRGNTAPEVLTNGVVTFKADIYSLGVLIAQILAGRKKYSVPENIQSWGDRFGTSLEDTHLEQMRRVCAEIAKSCLEHDPEKRPDAEHIMAMLVEMDEFTKSNAQVSLSRVMEVTKTTSPGVWAPNINNNS